jgi:hypothetical protein
LASATVVLESSRCVVRSLLFKLETMRVSPHVLGEDFDNRFVVREMGHSLPPSPVERFCADGTPICVPRGAKGVPHLAGDLRGLPRLRTTGKRMIMCRETQREVSPRKSKKSNR